MSTNVRSSAVRRGIDGPRHRRMLVRLAPSAAIAFVLIFANPFGPAVARSPSSDLGAGASIGPVAHPALAAAHPTAAAAPTASGWNPYCHKVDTTVCVSMANQNETDIVPGGNATVCSSRPNSTANLQLWVKSRFPLNWTGNVPRSGPDSPIALNVTGVLWNGDPYYSTFDNTVWHANGLTWWTGPTYVRTNQSYPWWYGVTFSARSLSGGVNFFPGMSISWWIYLTFNNNNTYTHHEGPHFQCTFSGAWPYSPYPGSHQYAGASAYTQDVNITLTPPTPNWNDTVGVIINTTQADGLIGINATIGSAYLDLKEFSLNGSPIQNGTIPFPVNVSGNAQFGNGFGQVTANAAIPAQFAQVAGALISYQLHIFDVSKDQLVTPWANYTVGGNGSFASGVFTDDLGIGTSPNSILIDPPGGAVLNPGERVNITVTSRNPGASIYSSEIGLTVTYPALNEVVTDFVPLTRVHSTVFVGSIPGLPIGTQVTFSVYAWDFNQRLEVSPSLSYSIPTFSQLINPVLSNQTFFFVYVYDNGSHHWVDGARVQVVGPHGFFNSVGNTTLGVAYPNETGQPFAPLLLAANVSYTITVSDPTFVPTGFGGPVVANATIVAGHDLSGVKGTIVQTANYLVVQEGSAVVFYLNSTPIAVTYSPSTPASVPLETVIGIVAAFLAAIPILWWYSEIRARRKAEERRVTL